MFLRGHEPYPAVVVDRTWNLVAANSATRALMSGVDVEPALLEPPINVLRLGLHPRGFGSLVVNLAEWRAHFFERLERQIALTGDSELAALAEEIASYPIPATEPGRDAIGQVRVRLRDGGELSFFGMFATFDTPFDVTSSELAVELLFPADRVTATALRERAPGPMSARGPLRLVIGGGGALLIGSLFMPWARSRSGWELLTTADVFFLVVGIVALAAAITGGRIGVFRPDVSLNGAADLLGVVAIVLIAWLAIFDFPGGGSREAGVFVALAASLAIAGAAGDYRVLRGASLFPPLN